MVGLQLLAHQVQMMRLVGYRRAAVLAGTEVLEEIPRDDRGLVASAQACQRPAQRDPLRLVRRVEGCDAAIETGGDDVALQRCVGGRIAAELLNKGLAAQNQRNVVACHHDLLSNVQLPTSTWRGDQYHSTRVSTRYPLSDAHFRAACSMAAPPKFRKYSAIS